MSTEDLTVWQATVKNAVAVEGMAQAPVMRDARNIVALFSRLRDHCRSADLTLSLKMLERISASIDAQELSWSEFQTKLGALAERMHDELQEMHLLQIAAGDANYYQDPNPFGAEVATEFQRCGYDSEEASKCIAVDRSTAVVFHLCRVLEEALKGLAATLSIPDPVKEADRNWGRILEKIRKELDLRNSSGDTAWKNEKDFYENVYIDLCAVRTAWRNPVMHIEGRYDSERAREIYHSVRGFMRHLAQRVKQAP